DAGDAVTHRQHGADFGHFGFGAEIGDLILQDRGDLGGADVHQAVPFIASCSRCSLVRSELSIMRDPTLTISPPIRAGSTFVSMATVEPIAFFNASVSAFSWVLVRALAEETSAVTSPRRRASSFRKALMMPGRANSRRLIASVPTNFLVSGFAPALSRMAAMAFDCSSRDRTGERVSRARS